MSIATCRWANLDILSCDCQTGETVWIYSNGDSSTADIWQNTTRDSENRQAFRLVGYPEDYPGVLALELT